MAQVSPQSSPQAQPTRKTATPPRRPILARMRWWKLLLMTGSVALAVLLFSGGAAQAEVVGTASAPIAAEGAVTRETPLGNLLADAVRAAASKSERVDIALVAAGSLTETALPEGNVTDDAIRKSLAFPSDRIVVVRLTGEQIRKALERSVSMYPKKFLGYLQVSGLTFSFRDGDLPEGSRVQDVKVGGVPLSPTKQYTVAMPEPLGVLGDHGYKAIWGKPQVVARLPVSLLDALVAQVKTQQRLVARVESRIRVVKS